MIDGSEDFFEVTKRIHHFLHGEAGDGGALGEPERRTYEDTLADDAGQISRVVRPGEVVVLHDPQTLGLAPALRDAGARLIWSCHVGADAPNAETEAAWDFLRPYVEQTSAQVFSRPAYRWAGLAEEGVTVIPPCLDAFSAKNQELAPETVRAILIAAGVLAGPADGAEASFVRRDGSDGAVTSRAQMIEVAPLPTEVSAVTQVSRWDPLKDHRAVLTGFVEQVAPSSHAHLVVAGPAPEAVSDDPEDADVAGELREAWARLEPDVQRRVHIAFLPMGDVEENAAMVNALQRHSEVIVQKSLAVGFGLTVSEAMWKGRAVVGSRVGGIPDQIEHGVSGLLIDDPADLAAFGRAVLELLGEPERSQGLGSAARQRVAEHYLAPRYLTSLPELAESVSR